MGRRPKNWKSKNSAISFAPDSATIKVETPTLETPQETPQENLQENPQENFPKPVKERLSWPISESGKFDVQGFRKETAEQAREIARQSFLDPEFRKWAGIEQETGPIANALFPDTIAGQVLDLVASVETLALSRKLALPYDEVKKFMQWTKEEHEVLDAQGARLARKHIPAKWLENADAAIFLASITGLAAMKARAAQEYAAKRLEEIGRATGKDAGRKIEESPKVNGTHGEVINLNPGEGKSLE